MRSSNLELLRIFSMFLIVCHHFAVHSGFKLMATNDISFNILWTQFLAIGGKLGVDLFVLISGYFLIKSNAKPSSLLRLWLLTAFYGMGLYIIFSLTGDVKFSVRELLINFLGLLTRTYWFVTCYAVMFIFSPFIANALRGMSKEAYKWLLFLSVILWSLIPTLAIAQNIKYYYSSLIWFFVLFAIAGYLRLYVDVSKLSRRFLLSLTFISLFFIVLYYVCIDIYVKIYGRGYNDWFFWARENSFFVLVLSIAIFVLFLKLKDFKSKLVNYVSATMFGVYLIHDNYYVRKFVWRTFFHSKDLLNDTHFFVYSMCCIVSVFICCVAIEFCRSLFLEKIFTRISRSLKKYDDKVKSVFNN